ncbi:MAG: hypothetical protein LBQ88_22355 [Treponema sp.]|jgi:hypothetical protein|nr:hypothetical protein [Treponema sp.]
MKKSYICLSMLMLFLCLSCSARIEGALNADGSAEIAIQSSLEAGMASLIRSLSRRTAAPQSKPAAEILVLDGQAIARSMAASPGITSVSFVNTASSAIAGTIKVSKIDEFLRPPGNSRRLNFITYEQKSLSASGPPGGGRLLISLDRSTGPEIVSLISADAADYLSSLMAPVATGEQLTRQEYMELVTSVYRKETAAEISAARIRAAIEFPGPIVSVRGGTFSGSRAEFNVPLIDLLVLEAPLSYEVVWR